MNIQLNYMYRDYANYKNHGEVIFSNPNNCTADELTKLIQDKCMDGVLFYAHLCGIPTLFFPKYDPENDHPYHEFIAITATNAPATHNRSVDEFIASFPPCP